MLQSKKFVSHDDIEKKEREIEALLKKVLRDPIGDYQEEREKLDRSFKKIQDIAITFGDRLCAVPEAVQSTVEKLRKNIADLFEEAVEELEEKVDSLHDSKIVILEKYLNNFDLSVQKIPDIIREITNKLKENIDVLVAEKTKQLSEQMDRLPHAHEAMETKIHALFEIFQEDFRKLAEQRQKKHFELLTSFDQYSQSVKDLSLKITHEVEQIPEVAAQRFKVVIDECQIHLKNLIDRQIDQVEEMNCKTTAIQEKIKIDLKNNTQIIGEKLDRKVDIVMLSLEGLQDSFSPLENNEKLILSTLENYKINTDKEISILKNELADVHRNARSHKMVLMVLLIITLFVTCGDGVLEALKFFQH